MTGAFPTCIPAHSILVLSVHPLAPPLLLARRRGRAVCLPSREASHRILMALRRPGEGGDTC